MLACVVLCYVEGERVKGRLMGIPVLQICLVLGTEKELLANWTSALTTYEKNVAACQHKMIELGRILAGTKAREIL